MAEPNGKDFDRAARIARDWADPLCHDAIVDAFVDYFTEVAPRFDEENFRRVCRAGGQRT